MQLAYLFKSIIKSNLMNRCPTESPGGRGFEYKKVGMFVEAFEIDPEGRPISAWLAHFLTPKRDQSGRGSSILC